MRRTDSLERPWCWERLKAGGEGNDRGWGGWMASPTWWTWVWASSWSWWSTGKLGMLNWFFDLAFRCLTCTVHQWVMQHPWSWALHLMTHHSPNHKWTKSDLYAWSLSEVTSYSPPPFYSQLRYSFLPAEARYLPLFLIQSYYVYTLYPISSNANLYSYFS